MFSCRKTARVASVFCRPIGFTLLCALANGCEVDREYDRSSGQTMGTQYRITASCPNDMSEVAIGELHNVNDEMSTYLEGSTLSVFNRAPVQTWVPVTPSLVLVTQVAAELSEASGGAFDVTVGPLVNLWGFGPNAERWSPPDDGAVAATREKVGFARLSAREQPPGLLKTREVYVDLSAIAKGHGVDRIAAVLESGRCSDFLVDIGGEVRASGVNPDGERWRIGIEVPDPDRIGAVQRVLLLENEAVATSGDYRNFIEARGRRYSHTIDPRTGYPVDHNLASVSVMHESAMWADGYATTLNVLGPERGLEFATRHGLSALFVVRTADGFEERYTPAMRARLESPQ